MPTRACLHRISPVVLAVVNLVHGAGRVSAAFRNVSWRRRTLERSLVGNLAGNNISDDDNDDLKNLLRSLGRDPDSPPPNPFESPAVNGNLPSKLDLYNSKELENLLQVHESLQRQTQTPSSKSDDSIITPSLHDLVVQTAQQVDSSKNEPSYETVGASREEIQMRIPKIRAIALDVDGTLLTSKHKLHPRTQQALELALQQVDDNSNKPFFVFLATGKSRKGALASLQQDSVCSLTSRLAKLPGVFNQGLSCWNAQGALLFEQRLTRKAIEVSEDFGKRQGVCILGYDGDTLYTTELTPFLQNECTRHGEPIPEVIPSLAQHASGLHKILFVDADVERLQGGWRTELEELAQTCDADVTQAVATMVEFLPRGCSKALGVEKLCQELGVDPSTELLAIGDGENDIGMLQMASIGVAMGNASPITKASADVVMKGTNDDGAAGDAMQLFGLDKQTSPEVSPLFTLAPSETIDSIQDRVRTIRAIATDVDGTLLTSTHKLHPLTQARLEEAFHLAASGDSNLDVVFLATGKSRQGAFASLIDEDSALSDTLQEAPGVFSQGLSCYNSDGQLIFEQRLTLEAIQIAEEFGRRNDLCMVAYDGDDLFTTELTPLLVTECDLYKEPIPKVIPAFSKHKAGLNKIAFVVHDDRDSKARLSEFRAELELLAASCHSVVTSSVPNSMELLPLGCSKALGVEKMCQELGIDPSTELLALGDGENDIEMLQLASIGVAMANGHPKTKACANVVMNLSNDEGGAGAAIELLGFGEILRMAQGTRTEVVAQKCNLLPRRAILSLG